MKVFAKERHREVDVDVDGDGDAGVPIDKFPRIIGRGSDCDFLLTKLSVSRRHCRLILAGGKIQIEDLKSRNGTYLNGNQLEGATAIADGDRLEIASYCFICYVSTNEYGQPLIYLTPVSYSPNCESRKTATMN